MPSELASTTSFTQQEWGGHGHGDLCHGDFIQSDKKFYYKPALGRAAAGSTDPACSFLQYNPSIVEVRERDGGRHAAEQEASVPSAGKDLEEPDALGAMMRNLHFAGALCCVA